MLQTYFYEYKKINLNTLPSTYKFASKYGRLHI